MRVQTPRVGQVVRSRAGRDRGRLLVITAIVDTAHVYVADGELRMLERPKKKKLRHLDVTGFADDAVLAAQLACGQTVQNAQVRKHLAAVSQGLQAERANEEDAGNAASAAVLKGRPQGKED